MLSETDLIVNRIAQGKLSLQEGLQWFRSKKAGDCRQVLNQANFYLQQARPEQQLIEDSLEKIPVKLTTTPIILFKKYPYRIAAKKVCALPEYEFETSFITLVCLFTIADSHRRKTFCKHGCQHEWHNLED